jgi:hypothetical protein
LDPLRGQAGFELGHTLAHFVSVGRIGGSRKVAPVHHQCLFEIAELSMALGEVEKECRIRLGQMRGLELIERLPVLAHVVEPGRFAEVCSCRSGIVLGPRLRSPPPERSQEKKEVSRSCDPRSHLRILSVRAARVHRRALGSASLASWRN